MKLDAIVLAALAALVPLGCSHEDQGAEALRTSGGLGPAPFDPDQGYSPRVTGADLDTAMTNTFFPAPPGARWVYRGQTEDGLERIEVSVERGTRAVWGAEATVVRDTVYLDDEMIEDTRDWYAQDDAGNVWYLGEDTAEYENGEVVCHCGAWESGVDGALPGVQMLGAPAVGTVYRQEYYAGEAEDVAEVIAVDVTATVPAGTFTGCITTRDRSALDLEADERKTYCPGVGLVLEESDDGRVELVERSGL